MDGWHLIRVAKLLLVLLTLGAGTAMAQWAHLGPDGGDARHLAYDPQNPDRIFLGTNSGQLYLSRDGGATWSSFARLGGDDYVLDNIAIDPRDPANMYVGAWSVLRDGGDLFRSRDGGRTWQAAPELHGKSIRSLALAPSHPRIVVAGALDGVYRSSDGGDSWSRISPANDPEIKNIESLAVDPGNADVVYAGTWHLPWKTEDGGKTWHSIKRGVIDDSDVFSIIIDPDAPKLVYMSACTGIYKSEKAGELFRKVQGIPESARRTRVLRQDPVNAAIVYAGTTEGLWKTLDAGDTWKRITAPNLIVNDVMVDPRRPQRVLLATDRRGVLASQDGGAIWEVSNRGFTHRQVTSVEVDRDDPNTIYAGLVNDKEFGGIFVTHDGGSHWQPMNDGLDGRDVFSLRHASTGELLAGTNQGVFLYRAGEKQWSPINLVVQEKWVAPPSTDGKMAKGEWHAEEVSSQLKARVGELALTPQRWFAATSEGVFVSVDQGKSWHGGPVLAFSDFIAVDAWDDNVIAATPTRVLLSRNGGSSWRRAELPSYATAVQGVALAPDGLWLSTREGAFLSRDHGASWEHVVAGPPARQLIDIRYDREGKRLLGVADRTGEIFESRDGGSTWLRAADPGYPLRALDLSGGYLLGITQFDGIVAQPGVLVEGSRQGGAGSGGN